MAPRTENLWWLGAILWPFVMGAVAINVFLAGLILASAGLPSIAPIPALIWALPLSIPATWAAAIWVRSLIREGSRG
ncbi:MAG: hypothetical protein E6Q73_04600 [Pseudorhodobacter sp.]|nr:MAG: hypothetical protein E6Q73_04600 [Pseudorhodobacter sp.]